MRISIYQSLDLKTCWSLEWYSCVGSLVYRSSGTSGQPVVKFTWSSSTSDIWQQITIENSTTKSNNITINKIIYDECSIGELNNHPRSTDFFGSQIIEFNRSTNLDDTTPSSHPTFFDLNRSLDGRLDVSWPESYSSSFVLISFFVKNFLVFFYPRL